MTFNLFCVTIRNLAVVHKKFISMTRYLMGVKKRQLVSQSQINSTNLELFPSFNYRLFLFFLRLTGTFIDINNAFIVGQPNRNYCLLHHAPDH